MTTTTKNAPIDLSKMDAEQVAALVAQVQALQQAEQNAVKSAKDQRQAKDQALTKELGTRIVSEYLPEHLQTFESTAQGVLVAGCKFEHEGVSYTIGSVLVRVTSTIPAKAKK